MPPRYPERHPMQSLYVLSTFPVFEQPGKELSLWTTCPIGILVLVKWFFNQDTSPDMSINKFLKYFEYKDMRLIGRRDFAWVSDFPGLGINTTLVCLQLTGI